MARRRRSLLGQIIVDSQRARAQRERANRQAQAQITRQVQAEQRTYEKAVAAEKRRVAAEARERERLATQARRAADRAEVERQRVLARAAADERKRAQAADRAVAAEAARQRREETERALAEREQAKAEKERARAELQESARTQTEEVDDRLAQLAGVLSDRPQQPLITSWALEEVFNRQGPDEFCAQLQIALLASPLPVGVPADLAVLGYRPEARELVIERKLPRDGVIPAEKEFRVVKQEVRVLPRKDGEVRHLYGQFLARTALRTLADVFAATPATLVDSVVLNGRVTAVDRATGKVINPHLLSVQFLREAFEDLQLDAPELDPELCLRAQNALISPHPHDLVPVKPLLYYDLDRYKTIAGVDLLVDLDSRLDLLTLSANEFETLIRQLFESRGLKSWQTQASRDDGIDAIAVNEDVVLGGLAIIQAKRYSKVVPYESVTALAGVMNDKAASKGILVTTSWVGKASRDFAERNGRIQIIEGRELKQLLTETLNMDVLISLPVLPRGWERAEIA